MSKEKAIIHINNVSKILGTKRIKLSICTIVFVIESPLLPLIIPAIWVITGSTILRVKVTKGCKSFYVCTITQIVYYSMDKYLTKLLKL